MKLASHQLTVVQLLAQNVKQAEHAYYSYLTEQATLMGLDPMKVKYQNGQFVELNRAQLKLQERKIASKRTKQR